MSYRLLGLAVAVCSGFLFATILPGFSDQEVKEDSATHLARRYAEANVELAEVELEMRLTTNERFPKTFTAREIDRSKMSVEIAKEQLRLATMVPKGDAVQLHLKHAELEARTAAGVYERALKAIEENPSAFSELQIKGLQLKAETAQLRLAMWSDPGTHTLSLLDHMHWQMERMSEELVELQKRVDKLAP